MLFKWNRAYRETTAEKSLARYTTRAMENSEA